jgi:hypothetical protein
MTVVDTGDRPTLITITPTVAGLIFRQLVKHAEAVPTQLKAFEHMMSETGTGRGDIEYRLKAGFFGVTCFFRCGDEWFVTQTREDESPNTLAMVDNTNLALALLRDTLLPP